MTLAASKKPTSRALFNQADCDLLSYTVPYTQTEAGAILSPARLAWANDINGQPVQWTRTLEDTISIVSNVVRTTGIVIYSAATANHALPSPARKIVCLVQNLETTAVNTGLGITLRRGVGLYDPYYLWLLYRASNGNVSLRLYRSDDIMGTALANTGNMGALDLSTKSRPLVVTDNGKRMTATFAGFMASAETTDLAANPYCGIRLGPITGNPSNQIVDSFTAWV